jgi:hypothetical protein
MKQSSFLLVEILLVCLPLLGSSLPTHIFDSLPIRLEVGIQGSSTTMRHDRKLQTDAAQLCDQAKATTLADENQKLFEWDCSCKEVTNELDGSAGSYHLTCESTCGHLCNKEETVCLKPGFISGIDTNNVNYLISQTYQYSRGRDEYVERRVIFDAKGDPLSCQYTIDENTCQSCDIVSCTTGGAPISLQCGNIVAGASFDFCTDPNPAVETGVFEFLSEEDFRTCVTIAPTPAPVQPTPPPVQPTPAPVVGTASPTESPTADSSGPSVASVVVSFQVAALAFLLNL